MNKCIIRNFQIPKFGRDIRTSKRFNKHRHLGLLKKHSLYNKHLSDFEPSHSSYSIASFFALYTYFLRGYHSRRTIKAKVRASKQNHNKDKR